MREQNRIRSLFLQFWSRDWPLCKSSSSSSSVNRKLPEILGIKKKKKKRSIKMRIILCDHANVGNFGAQRGRCLTRDFSYLCALIKIVRPDYFVRINVVNLASSLFFTGTRYPPSARPTVINFLDATYSITRYIPCLRYIRCDRYAPVLQLIIYRVSIRATGQANFLRNLTLCKKICLDIFVRTKIILIFYKHGVTFTKDSGCCHSRPNNRKVRICLVKLKYRIVVMLVCGERRCV